MQPLDLDGRKKIGRNDPCPCGSGKKFKKCCMDSDERFDDRRIVERNGQRMLVSSGVSDAQLAAADEFFASKAVRRGPAADIADFAAPLIDATDGTPEAMQRAIDLAMLCWNFAVLRDVRKRDEQIDDFLAKAFKEDGVREECRATVNGMIERHRAMFPEMHERRS